MAEHKHAEVLRAIADGKPTQWRVDQEWFDASDCSVSLNPLSCQSFEWRVKPEPKPDVVRWSPIYKDTGHPTFEGAKFSHPDALAFERLTINGETGKLSVEIVE